MPLVANMREGSGRRGGGGTFGAAPSPTPSRTAAASTNADADFLAGLAERAQSGAGAGALAQRENIRMVTLRYQQERGYRPNDVFRDALVQRKRKVDRKETDVNDARLEWYRWTDEERRAWAQYLVSIGAIDPEEASDMGLVQKLWESAVDEAANYRAAGKENVTPWDAVRVAADFGGGPGSKKGGFTGSKTQRSQSVDLTDPTTARAMVNDVLSRRLGREATDDEVRAFTETLNAAERANPTITETIAQYRAGDLVNQSSTTSGGLSAAGKQRVLDEEAMAAPEYGAYQAAAFYAPLLMQAISAPV